MHTGRVLNTHISFLSKKEKKHIHKTKEWHKKTSKEKHKRQQEYATWTWEKFLKEQRKEKDRKEQNIKITSTYTNNILMKLYAAVFLFVLSLFTNLEMN